MGLTMLGAFVRRGAFCAAAFLVAAFGPARAAGTISLAWDPVANAAGYRVYYSQTSGSFSDSQSIDVGNVLGTTISGLTDCTTWYLAVKAYNGAGSSPNFSNEVSGYPRPTVTATTPAAAQQGDQITIDVTGTNFQTGAVVELNNPNVLIQSARALSCTHVQFLATIDPTAPGVRPAEIGDFTMTVVNPDDVFGSRTNGFEVLVDPARFDVNKSDTATSGRLDGKDTVWISRVFGGHEGDALYDPDSDFNGDGWVDGADLSYVAGNLGRCWTGSAWSASACSN
jgi:hypothetical protein